MAAGKQPLVAALAVSAASTSNSSGCSASRNEVAGSTNVSLEVASGNSEQSAEGSGLQPSEALTEKPGGPAETSARFSQSKFVTAYQQ